MNILKALRNEGGFSQGELAERLGVSRQTLIKYEKSDTILPSDVIKNLSDIFEISPVNFIDGILPEKSEYNIIKSQENTAKNNSLRIDIPQRNINKFKEVLLYILGKVGSNPNVGQTVIYKLLYFIDFNFYELYEEQLIGAAYIKNIHGPTPVDFVKIVRDMQNKGDLEEIKSKYCNNDQTRYIAFRDADLSHFTAIEIKYIDMVLDEYANKSANALSELSHRDIPWITTAEREIIPYEAVFYRTPETSVRAYRE